MVRPAVGLRTAVVYTDGPSCPRIQYSRFQLSSVGRGPKKIWKIKEINGS